MTTDEAAVQAILQQFETAWNAYDSVSLAGVVCGGCQLHPHLWGQLDGRTAIEAAHRVIFNTIYRGSHASFKLRSIRFVRPDVAVASPERT